jgi:hypothetical protein
MPSAILPWADAAKLAGRSSRRCGDLHTTIPLRSQSKPSSANPETAPILRGTPAARLRHGHLQHLPVGEDSRGRVANWKVGSRKRLHRANEATASIVQVAERCHDWLLPTAFVCRGRPLGPRPCREDRLPQNHFHAAIDTARLTLPPDLAGKTISRRERPSPVSATTA